MKGPRLVGTEGFLSWLSQYKPQNSHQALTQYLQSQPRNFLRQLWFLLLCMCGTASVWPSLGNLIPFSCLTLVQGTHLQNETAEKITAWRWWGLSPCAIISSFRNPPHAEELRLQHFLFRQEGYVYVYMYLKYVHVRYMYTCMLHIKR